MTSGRIMPPVSPKEWNTGSTLNRMSPGPKSMRAPTCAQFDRMLRWRQDDALGRAFGAGGEQDRRRLRRATLVTLGRPAARKPFSLSRRRHAGADILQPDDPGNALEFGHHRLQPRAFDEDARGEDGPDLGGTAGGLQVGDAGRIVQHRRHPPDGLQGQEGDGDAVGVGQENADMLAAPRQGRELGGQHRDADQGALVGQRRRRADPPGSPGSA